MSRHDCVTPQPSGASVTPSFGARVDLLRVGVQRAFCVWDPGRSQRGAPSVFNRQAALHPAGNRLRRLLRGAARRVHAGVMVSRSHRPRLICWSESRSRHRGLASIDPFPTNLVETIRQEREPSQSTSSTFDSTRSCATVQQDRPHSGLRHTRVTGSQASSNPAPGIPLRVAPLASTLGIKQPVDIEDDALTGEQARETPRDRCRTGV